MKRQPLHIVEFDLKDRLALRDEQSRQRRPGALPLTAFLMTTGCIYYLVARGILAVLG